MGSLPDTIESVRHDQRIHTAMDGAYVAALAKRMEELDLKERYRGNELQIIDGPSGAWVEDKNNRNNLAISDDPRESVLEVSQGYISNSEGSTELDDSGKESSRIGGDGRKAQVLSRANVGAFEATLDTVVNEQMHTGEALILNAKQCDSECMAEPSGEYEYEALPDADSFRLLELSPGSGRDPIRCRLFLSRINSNLRYEAISYCWGTPSPQTVYVEGRELKVSRSLHEALRRIRRSKTSSIILWADQICINQNDIQERGRQVSIMGEIFKNAERALVYLGMDLKGNPKVAADTIEVLSNAADLQMLQYGPFGEIPYAVRHEILRDDSLDWAAFKRVINRQWFKRTWVVQEIGLARRATVLYSDIDIEWEVLVKISHWLLHIGGDIPHSYQGIEPNIIRLWASFDPLARWRYRSDKPYKPTLLHVLRMGKDLEATDPRDKIYAFLGHPEAKSIVTPQYHWSIQEVYTDFAVQWLERTNVASVLNLVNHAKCPTANGAAKFPSWCPRWDSISVGRSKPLDRDDGCCWYRASLVSQFHFKKINCFQLEVTGFLFDNVQATFPVLRTGSFALTRDDYALRNGPITFLSVLDEIFQYHKDCPLNYLDLIRTMSFIATAGYSTEMFKAAELRDEAHYAAFTAFCSRQSDITLCSRPGYFPEMSSPLPVQERKLYVFKRSMLLACRHRRFCATRNGYLCLGPEFAEEGDIICVLFGSRTPFVLRPLDNGTYLFLGECYVQGIMRGEAMTDYYRGKYEWQSFVLG